MQTTGIGTRVLNFLVDTILIAIISGLSYHGWNIYVQFYHYPGFNFGWFFFGTLFIYYTLFETLFISFKSTIKIALGSAIITTYFASIE